jgi:heme exporter protein CcmD
MDNAIFITLAYLATAILLGGLTVSTVWRARYVRRQLRRSREP